jgi:hypothetical protein
MVNGLLIVDRAGPRIREHAIEQLQFLASLGGSVAGVVRFLLTTSA